MLAVAILANLLNNQYAPNALSHSNTVFFLQTGTVLDSKSGN